MEETKTATTQEAIKAMNLEQKFVELRKAVPAIVQKQHSDGVKYKFAKIFDVYELLAPAMNEYGVNFDVIGEEATRHHDNGDPKYYDSYQQQTRNGPRTVWVYEADLTIRWTNADRPEEMQEITLHALGTNDGGPDKAKGSAWTYCLKYYLFEKFNIDQGEDDPDNYDHADELAARRDQQGGRQGQQGKQNQQKQGSGRLSDAQLERLYKKAEAAGMNKERTNKRILEKCQKEDPATLTREEYEDICKQLDAAAAARKEKAAAKEENENA